MIISTTIEIMSHPIVISDSFLEWASLLTIISAFAYAYKHLECHEEGCHRPGKYPHGHIKLCAKHHPKVSGNSKKDIEAISYSIEN